MIKGSKKITKNELLKYQEEIFRNIGIPVDFKKKYKNPIRQDSNPGCSFYRASNGIIYFNDWARPEYSGNALKWHYMTKHGAPYASEFSPIPNTPSPQKKSSFVKATYKKYFTEEMINYFKIVGVDIKKSDSRYKVKEINRIIFDKHAIAPEDLAMSYVFPSGREKIYRPNNNKFKWLSTTKSEDIWGWKPDGRSYCITSSMKDAITLQAEDPNTIFIAPQSENQSFDYDMIDYMRSRRGGLYLLYDNDEVGIKQAKILGSRYNIDSYITPGYKDPYDYKKHSQKLIIPNLVLL